MLVAGSDDGVYRISGLDGSGGTEAEKVLDAGRVMRVRAFEGADGLFAATETGLYWSPGGEDWTDLGVPREKVYAVAVAPSGDAVYAGTRPAHVYVSTAVPGEDDAAGNEAAWRDLEGFQALPSREEWRTPRHEDVAQVRSLCPHPDVPDRVVDGVEVGGVHASDDGGETWAERSEGVHDDVHELHVAGPDEFVAATGFGLYRSTDAGRSWTRLDGEGKPEYVRAAVTHDGTVYAGAAHGPSTTWDDRTDHALYAWADGRLATVDSPAPDELVIGWCEADGDLLGATHRGSLLALHDGEWQRVGSVPVPGDVRGRYLPLCWYER